MRLNLPCSVEASAPNDDGGKGKGCAKAKAKAKVKASAATKASAKAECPSASLLTWANSAGKAAPRQATSTCVLATSIPTITDDPDMVFISLPCTCEQAACRSTNRSGFKKTSTGSVRNQLSDELVSKLTDSRACQAARSGPVTSGVMELYRAGLV